MKLNLRLKIFLIILGLMYCSSNAIILASDARDTSSPYGVLAFLNWNDEWNHYHYPDQESIKSSIAMMKMAHVGIVRLDFSWNRIEQQQGVFNFDRLDFIVNELSKNDIRVLAILHYSPEWTGKKWNEAPDPELFSNYVGKTVEHFKDRVMYWEIWNEPDAHEYWLPQDGLKAYSALLKKVYPVIKSVDPTAQVLVGGVTKKPVYSMKKIYRLAGKDSFDIVNIHPFVNPESEDPVEDLRILHKRLLQTMEFNEDADKPIWFTEIGCPGIKPGMEEFKWWNGDSPYELEQADYLNKLYTQVIEFEGVQKIFWAFWRDTFHFKSGVDFFGLIRGDFSPKPAFDVFQSLASADSEK